MQAYSQDLRERVAAAALPHFTQGQVAAQFSVSVSFVAKLQQRHRLSGSVAAKPHSGGSVPCLTPRAEQRGLAQVARCPDTTLAELQHWLSSKALPAASEATLCRLLARHGWGRKKKRPRQLARHAPGTCPTPGLPRSLGQRRRAVFQVLGRNGYPPELLPPHGPAQPGQRVGQGVPLRSGGTVTVVGALTSKGLEAVMELDGALNEVAFATYLDQVLGPTLVPGEVVVLDNLRVHKMDGLAERVVAYGVRLLFLPPYSPDFNPVELAWSKLKTALRTAQARTRQALSEALTQACDWITKTDVQNWFVHCGYHVH